MMCAGRKGVSGEHAGDIRVAARASFGIWGALQSHSIVADTQHVGAKHGIERALNLASAASDDPNFNHLQSKVGCQTLQYRVVFCGCAARAAAP